MKISCRYDYRSGKGQIVCRWGGRSSSPHLQCDGPRSGALELRVDDRADGAVLLLAVLPVPLGGVPLGLERRGDRAAQPVHDSVQELHGEAFLRLPEINGRGGYVV